MARILVEFEEEATRSSSQYIVAPASIAMPSAHLEDDPSGLEVVTNVESSHEVNRNAAPHTGSGHSFVIPASSSSSLSILSTLTPASSSTADDLPQNPFIVDYDGEMLSDEFLETYRFGYFDGKQRAEEHARQKTAELEKKFQGEREELEHKIAKLEARVAELRYPLIEKGMRNDMVRKAGPVVNVFDAAGDKMKWKAEDMAIAQENRRDRKKE